jgi:hypothetical protein
MQSELSLIAEQQRQLLSEIGATRGDIAVLTAIVLRMDGTISRLVDEIRAERHAAHTSRGLA